MYRRIKPNHGCEQPSKIIVVSWRSERNTNTFRDVGPLEHKKTAAQVCKRIRGQWRMSDIETITRAEELWQFVKDELSNRQPTWLVGTELQQFLILTGFYEFLDSGEAILRGNLREHTRREPEPDAKGKDWEGLFVSEPDKVIIKTAFREGRLNIVGLENYFTASSFPRRITDMNVAQDNMDEESDPFDIDNLQKFHLFTLREKFLGLLQSWKATDGGNWGLTAAQLAWNNYRHRFLDESILTHEDERATALEKVANYGGECQVYFAGVVDTQEWFRLGAETRNEAGQCVRPGPVEYWDIRSCYPFCLSHFRQPVKLLAVSGESTIDAIAAELLIDRFVIARCLVKSDADTYPVRIEATDTRGPKKRTLYANGTFETVLCGEDLLRAVQNGHVREVYETAIYEKGEICKGYVRHWFDVKEDAAMDGDDDKQALAKMMLNSLYGKFCQPSAIWQQAPNECPPIRWGNYVSVGNLQPLPGVRKALAGTAWRKVPAPPKPHALGAIAASVTAQARNMVRDVVARMPDFSVVYQDTDGILFLSDYRTEFENIVGHDGGELGDWRKVGIYESAELLSEKNYRLGSRQVCAGLPRQAVQTGRHEWQFPQRITLGPCETQSTNSVVLERITRLTRLRPVMGRQVLESGWTVPRTLPLS